LLATLLRGNRQRGGVWVFASLATAATAAVIANATRGDLARERGEFDHRTLLLGLGLDGLANLRIWTIWDRTLIKRKISQLANPVKSKVGEGKRETHLGSVVLVRHFTV
jgi:hypothetical protein